MRPIQPVIPFPVVILRPKWVKETCIVSSFIIVCILLVLRNDMLNRKTNLPLLQDRVQSLKHPMRGRRENEGPISTYTQPTRVQ